MALSHAIMTALLDGPLSGYDLAREFDTSLGFFWHASHQQIYQELKKLEAQGCVHAEHQTQRGRPDRIEYALTADGLRTLDAWVALPSKRKPAKDDLLVKLYNVGQSDPAPLFEEIRQRREAHRERLALYQRIRRNHYARPQALTPRKQGIYLALAAGIRQETAALEWCEEALALLEPLTSR
jgi:PadR family transcriptional regulator, regulatory protein AphA